VLRWRHVQSYRSGEGQITHHVPDPVNAFSSSVSGQASDTTDTDGDGPAIALVRLDLERGEPQWVH
jgi:hypothetical protein